jgi:hypothetical protein
MKKNEGRKSRASVPLTYNLPFNETLSANFTQIFRINCRRQENARAWCLNYLYQLDEMLTGMANSP